MIPIARTADAGERPGIEAVPEPIRDLIGEYGRNGSLSIAAGAVSVVRGLQLVRSNRLRGFAKLLFGAGWIMIGLVQRQHAGESAESDDEPDEFDDAIGGEDEEDVDDVTPGETDDDIAASNTLPPSGVGEPEGHEVGETDPEDTAAEPAEMTGPSGEDAVPEEDKTTVPDEPPTDDVSMADDEFGDDADETDEEDEE